MFGRKKKKPQQNNASSEKTTTVEELYNQLMQSDDFVCFKHKDPLMECHVAFLKSLVNVEYVHRDVFPYIYNHETHSLQDIASRCPIENVEITKDVSKVQSQVLKGFIIIQINKEEKECLIIPAVAIQNRQIEKPETESTIMGPKEGFVESLDTNLHLIRRRVHLPQFVIKEILVGKLTQTRVNILYIQGLTNEENVNTVIQRIKDIEYDLMIDTSMIAQMIADDIHSPFPQFIITERPDKTSTALIEGKVAILVDGSPYALTCPTTIVEFFSAFDDYFMPWHFATAFRLLRLVGVLFSLLSSSLYVAVLTYHYQLIPKDLMNTLISSRSMIPFPPIMEALILESTIELLREAGARLPSKVGQTMGIVGGIVIGTASVQAGLTSNVLLILVAMSALASFSIPNYMMSTTIRLIRFPIILSAQVLGLIGIAICFGFFLAHLLKLTSLGRPYMEPVYPFRITDLKDALIRLPFNDQSLRPMYLRTKDPGRFSKSRANRKKDTHK